MASKWFNLKGKAIKLRRKGYSLKDVEKKLGISRSTLSYWFKNVELTKKQKENLFNRWKNGLVFARDKAILWHNKQKALRLETAKKDAENLLATIDLNNKNTFELALAMLYMGEGFKKSVQTGMGNSDPLILKFFVQSIKEIYGLDIKSMKCELHLRADQNPKKEKLYWSKCLKIPLKNFLTASVDKRTEGKATYPNYHGVCIVRCGNVAIQRKLSFISQIYCEKKLENGRVAQLV